MKAIRYSLYIFALLVIFSCHKIIQLPDTPYIKFRSFMVFDTTDILGNYCKGGRLKFYFEDGDGNVGMSSAAGSADTTNLFFTLYRKSGGVMTQVPDNDLMKPSDYRIPYIDRPGRNKILKGTIDVTFFYQFYSPADSNIIKYRFYLKDRADNTSDTAYTCDIPLSKNNTYTN